MQKQRTQVTVHYVASTTFSLDSGYTDLKPIGRGSYGVVCSAFSSKHDCKVAIKKITPVSKNSMDVKHVLREIKLMRHMGKHENIITLLDLSFRESSDELYIVMELLDSDLHRIIQSKQSLSEGHFKHFFFQLMCGVKYLHDNKIIHRDLKPGNLLVGKDCRLRITDFGLAREKPDNIEDGPMTEHVVTRWYRSPELMLCPDGLYSYPVDIWSCGCILAEMLGRNPLFPGKTFIHQLSLVFDVIGTPSPSDVRHIVNTEALAFLQSQRGKRKVAFSTLYPHAESSAWSLLDQTLAFAPSQRSTVDDILQSPYLRGVGTAPSLVFPPTSPDFCFPFENPDITRHELKQLLLGEISSFRRERSGASGGSGGISSRVKSQNNAEEKEEDAEAADKRSKSARRGDAADHQRERERHPSRRGSMRRAEDKDEAPAVPARHQHDVDDNMCQHNHNDSQANRNVPSYLRPTGHFRDRAASAPRPRPPVGAKKAEAIAMRATQRSDAKDADDGVSVNSGSVASSAAPRPRKGNTTVVSITSRQQQQQPKSGCGLLGEEGSLAEGDETPRRSTEFQPGMVTARSLPVSQRQQPTNAPNIAATATRNNARIEEDMSAVRTSTMRNLLHLCDEMYRDETAAHLHAEGSEAKHESTATGTASVQPQPQPRANPSRHSDAAYYAHHAESKHDQPPSHQGASTTTAASASAYAEESKNLSSACWPEGMFSPHARKQAPRFPTVSHQNSSDVKESARGLAIDAKQSNSNGLASEPPAVSSMAAQPKESPARNYTGGSSSGRGGSGSKATAYDRGDPSCDSNRDEGDNDDDDGLSPAPRSPLRKSLLQTYTSPTRLTSSQPSSSPMQRSPAARSKVAQATEHLHYQPRPQLTSSLSEKLLERARLLASGHTSASAHPVAKPPSETVETLYQQQRLHQSGCEAGTDDDSFMGDYSSTVHPTSVGGPSAVPRYESQRNRGIADNDATAEEREHDRAAAARNAGNAPPPPLAATGAVGESKQQRKFTVAKSPKFSLMSWQKRRDEQREAEERLAAQLLEDSKRKSLGKTTATKPAANGNYFGYQAPKRSDSAPRQRR